MSVEAFINGTITTIFGSIDWHFNLSVTRIINLSLQSLLCSHNSQWLNNYNRYYESRHHCQYKQTTDIFCCKTATYRSIDFLLVSVQAIHKQVGHGSDSLKIFISLYDLFHSFYYSTRWLWSRRFRPEECHIFLTFLFSKYVGHVEITGGAVP